MNRRQLLSLAGLAAPSIRLSAQSRKRRVVVIMMDGFGLEYYEASAMPTLKKWAAEGLFARVQDQMPAVTNTNNASICCGVPANVHGITGNSYFNRSTGQEDFMEHARPGSSGSFFRRSDCSDYHHHGAQDQSPARRGFEGFRELVPGLITIWSL